MKQKKEQWVRRNKDSWVSKNEFYFKLGRATAKTKDLLKQCTFKLKKKKIVICGEKEKVEGEDIFFDGFVM